MDTNEYVMAYRKIIPPNLNRWVMFRHGTIVVFPENHPPAAAVELREAAVAFMRMHGPVLTGTPSGDVNPFRLRDGLGWFVMYAKDGYFNFVPAADCPEPHQAVVIGLIGRGRRAKDAEELQVVHVELPWTQGTGGGLWTMS